MSLAERIARVLQLRRDTVSRPTQQYMDMIAEVTLLQIDGEASDIDIDIQRGVLALRRGERGVMASANACRIVRFTCAADGSGRRLDPPDAPNVDPAEAAEWLMEVAP